MAYGLSYVPNIGSGLAAGISSLGKSIGGALKAHGEQKGQANKNRSWLSSLMPERKEEFDQMGGAELEAEVLAYKAKEVDQSRNLVREILNAGSKAEENRNAQISALQNPDFSKQKGEILRLEEAIGQIGQRANNSGDLEGAQRRAFNNNLQKKYPDLNLSDASAMAQGPNIDQQAISGAQEQLGDLGIKQARYDRLVSQGNRNPDLLRAQRRTRLDSLEQRDVIDNANKLTEDSIIKNMEAVQKYGPSFQKDMEDFRANELRLNEISQLNNTSAKILQGRVNMITAQMNAEAEEGRMAAKALAEQPLDLNSVISGAFENNPLASPAAMREAVQLTGMLQSQAHQRNMQDVQKRTADLNARKLASEVKVLEATEPERQEMFSFKFDQAKTDSERSKILLDIERENYDALAKEFSPEILERIKGGDLVGALKGLDGPMQDRVLDAFRTKISLDNSVTQALYAQLQKMSDRNPSGLDSRQLTAARSLASSAASRLETVERQLLQAQEVTAFISDDNPVKSSRVEQEQDMKQKIELLKKEKEKYQGLIDKDLGLGGSTNASQSLPPEGTTFTQEKKNGDVITYKVENGEAVIKGIKKKNPDKK